MKNSDPTLAELGLPEKIAGYLAAAGVKTLSAIEAELEATGSLEHLEGIGPAYSQDVVEAIEAWREMAVDAEPVANDEAPAEEAVAEEPAEEPTEEAVAEEPIEEAVAEEPIEEAVAEEPAEEPTDEAVADSPQSPVPGPRPPAPRPIDLLRHEAANLSVLKAAAKILTDAIQEALEDFYRDRPVESPPGKGRLHRVVLRRELIIDGAPQTTGTPLAVVQLEPGIDLNFLVDAIRNGLASAK